MDLETVSLKSQMNPHFLFNAINNLQAIIAKRDDEATYEYISNLNILTSSTFSMSHLKVIALDRELVYLNSYLTISNYRLNGAFTYDIEVLPTLIPEVIFIPPLLIQPLIENAIIHGLKPLKGEKELLISFDRQNDTLFVKVRDNGIGREASAALKKEMSLLTHSLSSKIFDKRIALYNRINKIPLRISYRDLATEENETMGTEVVLEIPL